MTRIERVTKRATRERDRKERAAQREKKPLSGPEAAKAFQSQVAKLTRAHCIEYKRKDWAAIAKKGLVEPLPRTNEREKAARKALYNYRPGVIDSLFNNGKDRRRALVARVLAAAKADQEAFEKGKRAAEAHNTDVAVAAGVLARDLNAIEATLRANLDFPALRPALEGFAVAQPTPGRFVVYVDALEVDALPDEACVLMQGGRAAYAPLPLSAIQEMHLTNVCSIAIRVGVEVLGAVGVDAIEVVARTHLRATYGDDTEMQPVLYVKLLHEAMKQMDLRKVEPVSVVTALRGRIDWEAGPGFRPIKIEDLKLAGESKPPAAAPPAAPPAAPAGAPTSPLAAAQQAARVAASQAASGAQAPATSPGTIPPRPPIARAV